MHQGTTGADFGVVCFWKETENVTTAEGLCAFLCRQWPAPFCASHVQAAAPISTERHRQPAINRLPTQQHQKHQRRCQGASTGIFVSLFRFLLACLGRRTRLANISSHPQKVDVFLVTRLPPTYRLCAWLRWRLLCFGLLGAVLALGPPVVQPPGSFRGWPGATLGLAGWLTGQSHRCPSSLLPLADQCLSLQVPCEHPCINAHGR